MQIEMITEGSEGNDDNEEKVMREASLMLNRFRQERERLQSEVDKSKASADSLQKQVGLLQLENEQLRNNLKTMDSTCEELREESLKLRAGIAEIERVIGNLGETENDGGEGD